jgi:hypothetical protein
MQLGVLGFGGSNHFNIVPVALGLIHQLVEAPDSLVAAGSRH